MKVLVIFFLVVSSQIFSSDLVTHKSRFFHETTVSMVKKFLGKKKLKVFNVIDHHKGATKVKLNLDKTSLIIFGNPKVGTLLMQENQLLGLELPMKVLVHTHGKITKVTYKKIKTLKKEYNLSDKSDDLFNKIKGVFEGVSKHISIKEEKDLKSYD